MANISTYTVVEPKAADLIIGTQTYNSSDPNPVVGNPTVNFTVGSIIAESVSGSISGTAGKVPIFTTANSVGDSVMTQYLGRIGIGKSNPEQLLDVNGTIQTQLLLLKNGTDGSSSIFTYSSSLIISNTAGTNIEIGGGPGNAQNNLRIGNGDLIVNGDSSDTSSTSLIVKAKSSFQPVINGYNGVFVKDEFAGQSRSYSSNHPMLSLGTSTNSEAKAAIFMGTSATPDDQQSKIEYNTSNSSLGVWFKGQGTYREHLRFGNPSSSIPRSVFLGVVGVNEETPTVPLHVSGITKVDNGYIEITDSTQGLILKSPDGTRYRITVANGGTLSVSAV